MGVLHDVWCPGCDKVTEEIVSVGSVETCSCGSRRQVIYLKAPYTDVYGSPRVSQINDVSYSSARDLRKKMKEKGFEPSPSADKHHGARNESHLNLWKTYSYRGSRKT